MKKYTLYFEFFGRKMKTDVLAKDEEEAKIAIAQRIKFDKVEEGPVTDLSDNDKNTLVNMFGNSDNPFARHFGGKK